MVQQQNSNQALRIKRLNEHATIPERKSLDAAGVDLSSSEAKIIPAGKGACIKTGLAIACPPGTYGRVAPRSGLALKHSIDVGAGVVDADYRGEVGVILFNLGDKDFKVEIGDRIAQLILEQISVAPVVEVEELEETARGAGGFGSTGVSATKRARTENEMENNSTLANKEETVRLTDNTITINKHGEQKNDSPRGVTEADKTL